MSNLPSAWPTSNTEQGMLVAFGEFVQQHGLLERLQQVPIDQKTRAFALQDKLIEFLAGIMSGVEHLEDLNAGPHPRARDRCVAQAWGLERFAHYSSVSRTLAAGDDQTVAAVEAAITAFSRLCWLHDTSVLLSAAIGSAAAPERDIIFGQPYTVVGGPAQ